MPLPMVLVSHRADAQVRRVYAEELPGVAEIRFLADYTQADRAATVRGAQVLACFSPDRELQEPDWDGIGTARFVQCLAAGRDLFPFERFAHSTVAFNQGAAAEPIAEHTLAMVLAAAKNLLPRHQELARGTFNQASMNSRLQGGTATIVGLGAIGSAVARLLKALGMKVRAVNRSGHTQHAVDSCFTLAQLDAALDQADVAVVAVELNAQTAGAMGERQLRLLKPDATLVNVSRAAVIEQAALYAHLRAYPAFRACLDVWWVEPMTSGKFTLDYPFFDLPNFLGSPHNSPMVPGIFADLARSAARNIGRFLAGQAPLHVATSAM